MLHRALALPPLAAALALACGCATIVDSTRIWTFDGVGVGERPAQLTIESGEWIVEEESASNRVLAQRASSDSAIFNVALVAGTERADVDLEVRLRPVDGVIDRGGGLVWRARDARNYYIARYNPLEDNLRVYVVKDGARTQLQSADVPFVEGWRTLRVTMRGEAIAVSLDGCEHLRVQDATFAAPGRIGLWTKADARTWFDDLRFMSSF
jgi:hypothetical protein